MISKKSMIRQRLKPRIWDPHYFLAKNNLKTIHNLVRLIKSKNPKILDIGCGYKPFEKIIPYKEYVGIDFDKKSSEADIILDCSKQKIPFPSEYFDVIVLSETLEHVFHIDFLLDEIRRILKKKGMLFISTPFMFCEHGVPYDFYRFTKYFYLNKFKNYKIIKMNCSNSFLSAPFVVSNHILEHLPLSVFRIPFYIFNNISIALLEFIVDLLKNKNTKIKEGLSRSYEGISIILEK